MPAMPVDQALFKMFGEFDCFVDCERVCIPVNRKFGNVAQRRIFREQPRHAALQHFKDRIDTAPCLCEPPGVFVLSILGTGGRGERGLRSA